MTYPIEAHQSDTRSLDDQHQNLIHLNTIQVVLEESIGSYALQNPDNVYDEENQQILRTLEFSRGLQTHQIVIAPDQFIRWLSPKFPSSLLLEIHNALLNVEVLIETNGVPQ